MPKKIYILGSPGCGKNWLGERIAKKLKIPFFDIDDLRFIKKFDIVRPKKDRIPTLHKIVTKKR